MKRIDWRIRALVLGSAIIWGASWHLVFQNRDGEDNFILLSAARKPSPDTGSSSCPSACVATTMYEEFESVLDSSSPPQLERESDMNFTAVPNQHQSERRECSISLSFEIPFECDANSPLREIDLLAEEKMIYAMQEYSVESHMDPDAKALTQLFQPLIEKSIVDSGANVRLIGFACGLELCLGVLGGGGREGYFTWMNSVSSNSVLSRFNLQAVTVAPTNEMETMRFGFFVSSVSQ